MQKINLLNQQFGRKRATRHFRSKIQWPILAERFTFSQIDRSKVDSESKTKGGLLRRLFRFGHVIGQKRKRAKRHFRSKIGRFWLNGSLSAKSIEVKLIQNQK